MSDTDKAVADGMAEWDKANPAPRGTISETVADHIDHIRKLRGSTISVSALIFMRRREVRWWPDWRTSRGIPICSQSCYHREYTDEDGLKIADRNRLRAMRLMEMVATELQKSEAPLITGRVEGNELKE